MKTPEHVKRQAMSALIGVKKIAHAGIANLAGGIALYAAHIRQMERNAGTTPQKRQRDALGREW
jgi:hypothetical protein